MLHMQIFCTHCLEKGIFDVLLHFFFRMSFHAKELLNQLGSSMAQNMKFRDVWYFVGQKGIDGFTKFESVCTYF